MAMGKLPVPKGPLDLYDFVGDADRATLVRAGMLPWWTDEGLHVRFFRPLASAMLYAEHHVLSAGGMHVVSLAWWLLAIAAAYAWTRHVTGSERAAAMASAAFALAPSHVWPLALAANREVTVSVAFGALGLLLAARPPSRARAVASALAFSASLAAGEYGLCVGAYVVSAALLARGPLLERARKTLPFFGPAALYLALRAALGYGAWGTGFYRDPIHTPARFFHFAPSSLKTLVLLSWTAQDDRAAPAWALVAASVVVALSIAVGLSRSESRERLAPLVLGSLLALLPVLAAAPDARLLMPAMLGVCAATGLAFETALRDGRFVSRAAAFVLATTQLVLAPKASWDGVQRVAKHARESADRAATLASVSPPSSGTYVVPRASWETAFLGASLFPGDRPTLRVLVSARHALLLRIDERSVEVLVPKGQGFFPFGADDIFRSDEHPLREGDERDVPGMHVLIVADGKDTAARVRFTFDAPVSGPELAWLSESVDRFDPMTPPEVGMGKQLWP